MLGLVPARLAEQPHASCWLPCLEAKYNAGHKPLRKLTLGSACSMGDLLLILPAAPSPATSQLQPDTFCSFLLLLLRCTHALWLCVGGACTLDTASAAAAPGPRQVSPRLLKPNRQAACGQAFHQLPFAKPFSGQSCQLTGRAARGGCREAKPWCNMLHAMCTMAIEQAQPHRN